MSSNSVLNHTHDQQIGLLRRGGPILLSTRMTCPVQTMALIIRLACYDDNARVKARTKARQIQSAHE